MATATKSKQVKGKLQGKPKPGKAKGGGKK